VPILLTLHVLGAVFLLGGMTAHALLRPAATSAAADARNALYQLAWRIQVVIVYTGSALLLITGVLLWVGRFKLFTGWLLLGVLLFIAAMGLDGAFLAPTLRRARRGPAGDSDRSSGMAASAVTVQLVAWFLLLVVLFLMVARPF